MCQHSSINEQPKNESITQHNAKVNENYKNTNVWLKFEKELTKTKKKDNKPLFPKDPIQCNGVLKKKLVFGMIKQPVLQCMCATSHCIMRNSNISSKCFTGCMKPGCKNIRCPFPEKGECQCPVCFCKCQFAFHQNDHVLILHTTRNPVPVETKNSMDPSTKIQNFMVLCFLTVFDTASMGIQQHVSDNKTSSFTKQSARYVQNVFCENAALNISYNTDTAFGLQEKELVPSLVENVN